MLVLSRKVNQSILIDGGIRITVTSISPRQVRLAIEAPEEIAVFREELLKAKRPVGKILSRRWSWRVPVPGGSEEGQDHDSQNGSGQSPRHIRVTAEQRAAGRPSLVLQAEAAD